MGSGGARGTAGSARRLRALLSALLAVALLQLGPGAGLARGELLDARGEPAAAGEATARAELLARLERLGVPSVEAAARVASWSDEEVRAARSRLDALPAGGALELPLALVQLAGAGIAVVSAVVRVTLGAVILAVGVVTPDAPERDEEAEVEPPAAEEEPTP